MHPRGRIALIFWTIVAISALAMAVPPLGFGPWIDYPRIAGVALLAILLAVFWRARALRGLREQEEANSAEHHAALKREVLVSGGAIAINGATGLWPWLAAVVFDAALVSGAVSTHGIVLVPAAALVTLALVPVSLLLLPTIGKPVLTLTREGAQPAGYGVLPWSAVHGIDLTRIYGRGRVISHVLHLFVPDLRAHLSGAHGFIRLLHSILRYRRFSTIVAVRLRGTSESPELVERLCRDLLKAATNRDPIWSSYLSADEARLAMDVSDLAPNGGYRPTPQELGRQLGRLSELSDRRDVSMRTDLVWLRLATSLFAAIVTLIAANLLVDLFTNFVASDQWLAWSGAAAVILALAGYALLARRLKLLGGGRLRAGQIAGIAFAIVVSLVLILPLTWEVVQNVIGDPIARTYGAADHIAVVATKTDSYRRRKCSPRLHGVSLGQDMCLTREEYDRLPQQVTVELDIRRNAFGYHVDARKIGR